MRSIQFNFEFICEEKALQKGCNESEELAVSVQTPGTAAELLCELVLEEEAVGEVQRGVEPEYQDVLLLMVRLTRRTQICAIMINY